MEHDPSDGKVTFLPVRFSQEPPMRSVAEVQQFFKLLAQAATAASASTGYMLYPIYELKDGKA